MKENEEKILRARASTGTCVRCRRVEERFHMKNAHTLLDTTGQKHTYASNQISGTVVVRTTNIII